MMLKRRTRKWLEGLATAAIGGSSTAGLSWIMTLGVSDLGFSIEKFSLRQLGVVVFCGGAASAFFYLKTKPLPDPADDTGAWRQKKEKP